ncbi:MAG: sigma-70 family RNA polymerase sigma factor [Verrucomicrobia bacterium]|nr:sigma-70 family RNA polymerase sigma factor [Verrucomicrobiota bacterium]
MNVVAPAPEFPPTRWSAVLRLREGRADASGEKALAELCEMYWYPLYAFARRCGQAPHDAEDLTQGFFARLLERDLFAKADPSRGRLRSFLLGAFRHFMSEEWRQAGRQKRGGGRVVIPLHQLRSEEMERETGVNYPSADPDVLFDRVWFDVLLEHALDELEAEYRRRGRWQVFRRLQEFLAWNRKDGRLAEAASELEMSPGAVRVTVLRMRARFRELIERQIAETVGNNEEAAAELEHLRRVLGA